MLGGVALNVEIIERKRLEEQLRLSQRLDAVGRLAGGIAHDFNNLLMVIGSGAQMALMDLPEESRIREDLGDIKRAADRAATLTKQLLAFSRNQVLQPQVLNLNETVRGTEKILRRLIGEDVELVTILDPQLGRVEADPGQIDQVLIKLAVNARDAMPTGGTLVLTTTNATITPRQARSHPYQVTPGEYVVVTVEDSGHGMRAETLAHIFEPFFSTKKELGNGLGLATVYGIVKQSGGYVWVESSPGGGTTFHVYLPRVESEAAPQADVSNCVRRGNGETILVVEDEGAVRQITERVLRRGGYNVLAASSGDEALRIAQQHSTRIDLVLTDVVMPRMSGRELAQRLAVLRPDIPVLYMSGYTDDAVVRHGIRHAEVHFLSKPFESSMLLAKVSALLHAKR